MKPIINAVSTATSFVGTPSIIQFLPGISWEVSWTGTTLGTIQVEVSNSYRQNADGTVANIGNWIIIPSNLFTGNYPVPAGSPGFGMVDFIGTEVYAARLTYTATSGTGTLTAIACAKVL